jgi:protein-tyrosine phosphatase
MRKMSGRMVGAVIDLHSHILPGLDDGARTIDDSRELARQAVREGIEAIAATPHVRADYPTSVRQMEDGVARLRRDFEEQGIGLSVLPGAEIDLERLDALSEEELASFTLACSGRYVLLEFPYGGWPLGLEQTVFRLRLRGFQPLLAHPERNREVQERPERLETAVAGGALLQITTASVDGRLGRRCKAAAGRLLELRLAHVLASDAHPPNVREAGYATAIRALADEQLVRYLTAESPTAIVCGEDVPPPPPFRRRRFGIRRASSEASGRMRRSRPRGSV